MEWKRGSFVVSDDSDRIDLALVHGFLTEVYWAKGIPLETVQRSIANSLCFSVFENGEQIGFARVITDRATFAYLCDVFVLGPHRGKGASKLMMESIMAHPSLQGLRRWMLLTDTAHGLYRQFGFRDIAEPRRHMEISRPKAYDPQHEE